MKTAQIFLSLSPEATGILEQNQISVQNVLEQQHLGVTVRTGIVNYESNTGERTKDVGTIIMASTALIATIGYVIATVITALGNKPQIVEIESLEELRDKDGNVVLDKEGNPVFKTVKKVEIVDPAKSNLTDFSFEAFKVFKIKITTKK